MKRGNSFHYYIKQGWQYFWHNKMMSLASVGVLVACLLIMGSFWLIVQNMTRNIDIVEGKNEVVLYVDENADVERSVEIGTSLRAIENIATVRYLPKDEAFDDWKSRFPEQADLFSDLEEKGDNPLRNSYIVTMKDLELYDETVYTIENIPDVAKVVTRKDLIDQLLGVGHVINVIGYTIMGLLFLASLFIIVNTIKLARFVYRKQINIMKCVGATDWFIRWPFIIEGALIGLLAGLIAYGLQYYVYNYLILSTIESLKILSAIPFSAVWSVLFGGFVGGGLLVGVLGSAITIRKYLEV
ncbi:permease-like cell division protein FtsX [Feifania hominis]|uniref:Cell division protein FtsX n=1 Tax=Feifania hominis TaxID=2763660 RepID=A0A926HTS0_9FIRM|nr:permease-like cell division protein FtsX [Feifania hominis]MBC8535593.1 ABC transporter permease [Feifania hominis]